MTADPVDFEAALDRQYDEVLEDYLHTAPEGTIETIGMFQINDPASADWALRKIRRAQALMAEADATADQQITAIMAEAARAINPIRAYQEMTHQEHEQTVRFFSQLLQTYHRRLLAEDPKRKTIKLPHGTLSARQGQAKWSFSPEFVEWAKANATEVLRVKHEVDVAEAKKALSTVTNIDGEIAATYEGEIVPGVEIEPPEVKFSLSTDPAAAKSADGDEEVKG